MFVTVMCEYESGFRFESGFKAFLAGFGFGFRPEKYKSKFGKRGGFAFGFMGKGVDSDSVANSRCLDLHITGL